MNPEDRRTKQEKCEEVGIAFSTLWKWMKDKRYVDYVNSQIDQYTNGELAEVWKALINQCKRGNIQAIKLFFEMKELHPDTKAW
ncbi:phBC6A51 family helix-turn-helix protein [Paradesulfitobacterium aromaticivorans]